MRLKPILKEIIAPKLLIVFKKRIAELINFDMEEIDQILELNKKYIKKITIKFT